MNKYEMEEVNMNCFAEDFSLEKKITFHKNYLQPSSGSYQLVCYIIERFNRPFVGDLLTVPKWLYNQSIFQVFLFVQKSCDSYIVQSDIQMTMNSKIPGQIKSSA